MFKQVQQLAEQGLIVEFDAVGSDGVFRHYRLAWNVPLNASNPDVRVDFLDVEEPGSQDAERCFTFILEPLLGLAASGPNSGCGAGELVGKSKTKRSTR